MRSQTISFLALFMLAIVQICSAFDARSGMSAPWASLIRNRKTHIPQTPSNFTKNKLKNALKSKLQETPFKENFFQVKVDHFSVDNSDTFPLRYLVSDKYYTVGGPILFYCGNEGPIDDFWGASGFITENLAKTFHALVIFGEHRFFGKSFPYNWKEQDLDIKKNKFLSVEQALVDFVDLITYVKSSDSGLSKTPVIAFGGSYGGMLSSWARMKFPHVFQGAVASSAPILLFEDINIIQNNFFKIVTETYKRYDSNCPSRVREGFDALLKLRNSTFLNANPEVINELNDLFRPCKKMTTVDELVKLESVLEDAVVELAQYNYPYETHFLNPLPATPANYTCHQIADYYEATKPFSLLLQQAYTFSLNKYNKIDDDTKRKLNYLKLAVDVYYNYTGTQKCLDIGNDQTQSAPPNGWEFLACTEMVMPMEKNGVTDMFNPAKWNLDQYSKDCKARWNADVRPSFAYNFYGGRNYLKDFSSYSNLYFVNGKMDPWNAGCVQNSPNSETITVFLADSAHHLDLRTPNKDDPESIVRARQIMEVLIRKWIVDFLRK